MTDAVPGSTVDAAEIAKFEAISARWWDPEGPSKGLHLLGPARLDFITGQIAAEFDRDLTADRPFAGLDVVDVGCGGGLVCEPLARLGASVTGIDAAPTALEVARAHAAQSDLDITYCAGTAEDRATETPENADVVLALEIVEHVAATDTLLRACAQLLKPGGLLVVSTLNRTPRSFALAVVGAEYVLRWLPRRTHDWRRFIKPEALTRDLADAGLRVVDQKGFVFDPLRGRFRISAEDLSVNYAVAARKPGA